MGELVLETAVSAGEQSRSRLAQYFRLARLVLERHSN
jgi:hypothetical protein